MAATASGLIANARRAVVKIGSSLLIDAHTGGPDTARFEAIAGALVRWRARGIETVLVSSGAVALGRQRLKLPAGKLALDQKQAAAAAGQTALMMAWNTALEPHGMPAAQALLTFDDMESRRRWLNARATLDALLAAGALPVINENDTVATAELRYGDNDRLAARVAQMCDAGLLVLLSDVDGLYSADPSRVPGAQLMAHVAAITPEIEALGGEAGKAGTGTGGMASKIAAARIAARAGIATIIAAGAADDPLDRLTRGAPHTVFAPETSRTNARRNWISGAIAPRGILHLDDGAARAVRSGKSLLPAGIARVEGEFSRGETVALAGGDGAVLAKGISAYGAEELRRIAGLRSADIEAVLGYRRGVAAIHVNDLVLEDQG
ncbi:glutamate 5-kinase [Glycocaulis albus]|uniref:Glutamate 5-kinase n=1 Tax=Glycocaulis albus TaxID=1382801 RepID=A0ABQ1XIV2_9PROT|nr:glutamate 5-kinase [Glycocaulis albus]GGG94778.1 glutamate 5-kinase [Glycocaulis albus]